MRRRALLAAAASTSIAAVAGCADSGGPAEGGTPTDTEAPCTRDREAPPDPGAKIEQRALPARPDEWIRDSVESYLREYEAAYRQRRILTADTTAYGHSESVEAIQTVEDGYRVELQTNFYDEEETDRGTVHADSPRYTVLYRVKTDRLLRAESDRHDVDPELDDAATMECW